MNLPVNQKHFLSFSRKLFLSVTPQSGASTNSAIPPKQRFEQCPEQDSNLHASRHTHLKRARLPFRHLGKSCTNLSRFERKTRLELATLTLARLCSTN